jgi:antitoxin (DNA-binding transcriptional repressor) of toxin-antitoxin stability system
MDTVAASHLKQNFGEVLARAALAPVGVQRHGKLVAAVVPAQWLERQGALDERQTARAAQRQVDLQRLMAHQRLGLELLCAPRARQAGRIRAALKVVQRWERQGLCSADYIARWRQWLGLSPQRLVQTMCSDALGWGSAMRQNSPFAALVGFEAGK